MRRAFGFLWLGLTCGSVVAAEDRPVEDLAARQAPVHAVWLDTLDLRNVQQEWGQARGGKSVDNNPLKLRGTTYAHGLGTHANSELLIDLGGAALRFESMVGVDDERQGAGSVVFEVWVDGRKAAQTGTLKGGGEPIRISVDLSGAKRLLLVAADAGDDINHDHADWAGAMIVMKPGAATLPRSMAPADDVPPKIAHGTAPEPRINGPRIVGTTPGRPFIFLIPATGEGPLEFSARGLPDGLKLDPQTGIITGTLPRTNAGEPVDSRSDVMLKVTGPRGTATRKLTIVGGLHKLALTPPMGWNSWNVWGCAVDEAKIRAAADAMIRSGLAAHGFQYVNIDDCWEGSRDATGEILTNEKFPDMKALGDYIHARGLRFGIYSSPGPKTCAGFEGSYRHEEQDAATWARWGVDYVKHDWCSYGGIAPRQPSLEDYQKPYKIMRAALDKVDRDIVYSLCQYGMGEVWKWGAEVGGNCWRTTGDIHDSWGNMTGIGFSQDKCSPFAGPGRWNDPDMLVVGKVGWGPSLHLTRLTQNEQVTHMTLWCLLAAPLLIGCDMSDMDPFTLDVLSNDEVIDVDQDPLGKAARCVARRGLTEVWARPLFDGTTAVGLFNGGRETTRITAAWSTLEIRGPQPVRDLWQRKDLGSFTDSYAAEVPRHGAVLVKIGTPRAE